MMRLRVDWDGILKSIGEAAEQRGYRVIFINSGDEVGELLDEK